MSNQDNQIHEAVGYRRHIVTTYEEAKAVVEKLSKEPIIAVDTETNSFFWYRHNRKDRQAQVIGVCLGTADDGYYIPTRAIAIAEEDRLTPEQLVEAVKPLLENPDIAKIFHNAKFDMHFLLNDGIRVEGEIHDTLNLHKVLYNHRKPHKLKHLAVRYNLVEGAQETEKVLKDKLAAIAKYNKKMGLYPAAVRDVTYDYLPLDIIGPYGCDDAIYTFRLYEKLKADLEKDKGKLKQIYRMEMTLMHVLFDMERRGMRIDLSQLAEFGDKELKPAMAKLHEDITEHFGMYLNLSSFHDKQGLLKLLEIESYNKHGKFTADKKAMIRLARTQKEPYFLKMVEHSQLTKLMTSYVNSLPDQAPGGVVHTSFNQMVDTGRVSSSRPNLHQLPSRTVISKGIKRCFYPPDGYVMLLADWSQVELRVAAEMSMDPELCRGFNRSLDMHTLSASKALNVPFDKITDRQRSVGKTLNFAILYGSGPNTVADTLNEDGYHCTAAQATKIIDSFSYGYAGLTEYIKRMNATVRKRGKAFTKFGRVRHLSEATTPFQRGDREKAAKVMKALRQGFSHVIQGTAADAMKIAIIKMHQFLKENNYLSHIVNVVHDEVIVYVHMSELHIVQDLLNIMEDFSEFFQSVPIKASLEASAVSWGDEEEFENFTEFMERYEQYAVAV